MSRMLLAFCIGLPIAALFVAIAVVTHVETRYVASLPSIPPLDAYDVDAVHRANLQARFPSIPPSEGDPS